MPDPKRPQEKAAMASFWVAVDFRSVTTRKVCLSRHPFSDPPRDGIGIRHLAGKLVLNDKQEVASTQCAKKEK